MVGSVDQVHDEAIVTLQETLDRLFYRDGVSGVTVAQVRDESGLSMRRLYRICPSKADLVSLWLRHQHTTWMKMFTERVEQGLRSNASPVDAVFDAVETWLVETEFRGCGFVNTFAESHHLTDEHVEIIQEHKRSVTSYLDGVTGVGSAIGVLVDGAIVNAAVFGTVAPVDDARKTAHALIASEPHAVSR